MESVKIKILFVSASPNETEAFIDQELREIKEKIRGAAYRDSLEMIPVPAARPDDLMQALLEHQPHIVHFSGRGCPSGEIVLLDESGNPKLVSPAAIQKLFQTLKDNIRLVTLNACYSKPQAEAIVQVIDCAVGMQDKIDGKAAINFVASFYRALGFKRNIQNAFDQGLRAMELKGSGGEDIPLLLAAQGIDPKAVVLIESQPAASDQPQPHAYSNKELRALLKDIFQDGDEFDRFCHKHFLIIFSGALRLLLLLKMRVLVNYCRDINEVGFLLGCLAEYCVEQGKQFNPDYEGMPKKRSARVKRFLRRVSSGKIHTTRNVEPISLCELTIEIPLPELTLEVLYALLDELADSLEISREDIKVRRVRAGSVILHLEVPSSALDRLIKLYETDRKALRALGISYVNETFDEIYIPANIRRFLIAAYSSADLADLVKRYLGAAAGDIKPGADKADLADQLLSYLQAESKIHELLAEAKKHDRKIYDRLGPYRHVPRKPGAATKAGRSWFGLQPREFATAATRGLGLAMGGAFLLAVMAQWLSQAPSPITSQLLSLMYLLLVPLGHSVGDTVLVGANYKSSQRLGVLALSCYAVGYSLGTDLAHILFSIIGYIFGETSGSDLLATAVSLVICGVVIFIFQVFGTLMGSIGFLAGGFLAYRRAS